MLNKNKCFLQKERGFRGFSNILNKSSAKCAESWGCHFNYEYEDNVNEITKVYVITKEEWNNRFKQLIKEEDENNLLTIVDYHD